MTDNSGLSTVALAQWVRPSRMAVLVPIVDDWEALALHVLAINTGIWGGSGNIVVPYDPVSGEIDDAILALVRRFDPDVWGDYHHTGRALELDDPARFESIVRERSPGHEHDRQWLELIRKDLRDAAWVAGAPPKLLSGLVKFSSPAWDRQYGRPAYLSTDTHPQHEAGLLVDAAQLGSLPDPLIVMNLGALPVDLRLLIASRFGAMNPRLVGALGRRDVPIFDVEVAADEEDRVRRVGWGLDGGGDWSLGYQLAVYRADYPTFAPYRLSETGLANFTVLTPHAHEAPVPVVVGDSFNDFAYAHALERDLGVALWLPGRLLPPAGQEHPVVHDLIRALQHLRHAGQQRPIVMVSRSLRPNALTDLAAQLNGWASSRHVTVSATGLVELPPRRLHRLLDMQGTSYPSGTAFIDAQGTMLNHALPGMPTVLTETPTDMVWWSDVIHPAHMLPARWTLNEQAAVHQGFNDPVVRVGTDGIAFASQARVFAAAGATLEQLLARPRLRFLDGLAVFRALADEAGVELVESDKGAYARLAVELWGELRSLINDLQPGPTRQLLDAWQSDEPSGKKPGNRIGDRRFLSIDDMINVLNASPLPGAENMAPSGGNRADVARDFTDRMLQQHVLRRGQCLMCTTCRHFGWYDADDVGQSFRCPRCRTTAVVDSRASKSSTPEIACYYQLHEAVHQALRHNFAIPMLATGQLTSQAHSTLWMSEHQVRFPAADNRPATQVEGDIWLVVDGAIIIGEAKATNTLGATAAEAAQVATNYARLADAFTADRVVFVTATTWTSGTKDTVHAAFKAHAVEPELIEMS